MVLYPPVSVIFLLLLSEKKGASQLYLLAREYYVNTYKYLITLPQQITISLKIRTSNLKSLIHPHYGHSSKIQPSTQQIACLARQKPELLTRGIFAKTHISLTLLLDYTIHAHCLKIKKKRQVIFSFRLQIQAPEFTHALRIYE